MPAALVALVALVTAFAAAASQVVRAFRGRRLRRAVCADTQPTEVWQREHDRRVDRVARQLRERTSTTPVSLKKRAVSHQVPKAGDLKYRDDAVDIADLDHILAIDPERRVCVCEPGVAFVDLVAATLEYGLVPLVVPELKTITVGGAVSGCSIESMSFRCGGFHDTCLEYEVITAGGDVLLCSADDENSLVFQMMHGSFGTLGILSRLTFRLVPAKSFVHVRYEKYATLAEYVAAIERHRRSLDVDFMDGIIHSPVEYVLSVGRFADEAPYTNRYDWWKIYYETTRTRGEDWLRTADYFFRYDHGVTQVHPKSLLARILFGKVFGSSTLLRLAERANRFLDRDRPDVVVDLFLPLSRVPAFFTWYQRELGHFPLWVVPYRRVRDYEWIHPKFFDGLTDELFLDIAIYGMKQPPGKNAYALIEQALMELGGIKTLISHNYYCEDDFWKTWNRDAYTAVKLVTDPNNIFRDLYDKTCRASRGLR